MAAAEWHADLKAPADRPGAETSDVVARKPAAAAAAARMSYAKGHHCVLLC